MAKPTAHCGRFEKVGVEPGTLPVGKTKDTVAAAKGGTTVAPALVVGVIVVAGTSASPMAEHWAPVMFRIPSCAQFSSRKLRPMQAEEDDLRY